MSLRFAILAPCTLALALSACASQQPRQGPPNKVIDAVLRTAPGSAQPSTIVALEAAFERLASETTPAAAFLEYAAPAARVQTPQGLMPAQQWTAQASFPTRAAKWSTRAVAIACNGALAASTGRFTDAAGIVGNYVMIWQRQDDGTYRWAYHTAGPDVPQPPPRVREREGSIVVSAMDSVQGLVASCPRGEAGIAPPPALSLASDAQLSGDGTLRWRWQQQTGGGTLVAAEYFYEGRWLNAFEHNLATGLGQ